MNDPHETVLAYHVATVFDDTVMSITNYKGTIMALEIGPSELMSDSSASWSAEFPTAEIYHISLTDPEVLRTLYQHGRRIVP